MDDLICWVLSYVEEYQGLWTARLCRLLNDMPETTESVMHCGRCVEYANQRKRDRASKFADIPTLPGLPPPYQLHPPCGRIRFKQLSHILRRLEYSTMIYGEPRSIIPDSRNWRGWDYATRWYPQA